MMLTYALKQMKTASVLLIVFTVITGIIYPVTVTGIAQLFFNWSANGSLIQRDGKTIGSVLIGQAFTDPGYFWGRPSATTPYAYNAINSMGSNLAAGNPVLLSAIKQRIAYLQAADTLNQKLIPVDLVTASASGLDPDISPLSAFYQVSRIARARNLPEDKITGLIQQFAKHSACNILGEPRVNVLKLNLALDRLQGA